MLDPRYISELIERFLLEHLGSVHLTKRVREQFEADAVRVLEEDGGAAGRVVLHAGRIQLAAQVLPLVPGDGDGDVVDVAKGLQVRAEVKASSVSQHRQPGRSLSGERLSRQWCSGGSVSSSRHPGSGHGKLL